VSEGLAQGPYVAARAGVEPMTLRTKGVYQCAPQALITYQHRAMLVTLLFFLSDTFACVFMTEIVVALTCSCRGDFLVLHGFLPPA